MQTNIEEMKKLVIQVLDLEDVLPESIDPLSPLFVDGLGLDSIDALELGVAIKKRFNVKLSAEDKNNRQHFYSISTLVNFVNSASNQEVGSQK